MNKDEKELREESLRREKFNKELFLDDEIKTTRLLFYKAGIEMFKEMIKHLKQMEKDNG